MVEVGWDRWKVILSNCPAQARSPTASFLGLCPGGFWMFPRMEIFPECCAEWAPQQPSGNNQRPELWMQAKA